MNLRSIGCAAVIAVIATAALAQQKQPAKHQGGNAQTNDAITGARFGITIDGQPIAGQAGKTAVPGTMTGGAGTAQPGPAQAAPQKNPNAPGGR
jgi:hypothetical protein